MPTNRAAQAEPDIERISRLVREILVELGEDPDREGLLKTPERVAKAYAFLTQGYRTPIAHPAWGGQKLNSLDAWRELVLLKNEAYRNDNFNQEKRRQYSITLGRTSSLLSRTETRRRRFAMERQRI